MFFWWLMGGRGFGIGVGVWSLGLGYGCRGWELARLDCTWGCLFWLGILVLGLSLLVLLVNQPLDSRLEWGRDKAAPLTQELNGPLSVCLGDQVSLSLMQISHFSPLPPIPWSHHKTLSTTRRSATFIPPSPCFHPRHATMTHAETAAAQRGLE